MQRVLIVDDEPSIVLALDILMKREGYETLIAEDGERAMQVIGQFNPHIVLLDIMMPRLDGYEVLARIRADAMLKDAIVILLTAKGRDAEREKGLSLGADAYITKPFSTRDVVSKVKEFLAQSPK